MTAYKAAFTFTVLELFACIPEHKPILDGLWLTFWLIIYVGSYLQYAITKWVAQIKVVNKKYSPSF